MTDFDVRVLGAGIVGRSLALALSRQGLRVALHAEAPRAGAAAVAGVTGIHGVGGASADRRTDLRGYALNAASVALLRSLKVWDALPEHAATPVYEMRIQGDAQGAGLDFSAWQQRVDALAWITDAALLERELGTAVRFAPHVTEVDAASEVRAPLTAVCEGKSSTTRTAFGIDFERRDDGNLAIAARLTASLPHRGTARQWFRSPDVLALLPFDAPQPGCSYALVWSMPVERARELLALDAPGFEARLMQATGGEAGELQLGSPRASWPLTTGSASAWSGPGWVLLGDAAHAVHPLAGQGLNLGLADVAALVETLRTREVWRPLGDEKLLRRYARERSAPTWAMGQMTDGLLQLFGHDAPVLRELRNRGLTLVNSLVPLKRWLTAQALGDTAPHRSGPTPS